MSDLLSNGVENLSGVLKTHLNTRTAFRLISETVKEICDFVEKEKKGRTSSLRKLYMSRVNARMIT